MGLAAPRKRVKISHDPRNLSWSNSTDSYGQRLLRQQGWEAGQTLGARNKKHTPTDTGKLVVQFKDDALGLGAKLRKGDEKTGLDAFTGLLGRLNGNEGAEEEVRVKAEERKLAMYTQGRWGGVVFVRGGVLVQGEDYKKVDEGSNVEKAEVTEDVEAGDEKADKARQKEERRRQKEVELEGVTVSRSEEKKHKKKKRRKPSTNSTETLVEIPAEPTPPPQPVAKTVSVMRNGRHLLRGKNIQAKKMALGDAKGLDEIFMRKM